MDAQINPTVFFTWQGGEPTLMGLDYYRKVLAIQARHARPQVKIANALQTNGLVLDDSWCAFLKENHFRVGLSIDGPADMHDAFRKTLGGEGTYGRVRTAVDRLVAHGVTFNTLTTISPANVDRVEELYDFLTAELKSTYLQFQPCVERKDFREVAPGYWDPSTCPPADSPRLAPGHPDSIMTDWSISARQWGNFLCRLFDRWWAKDRETVRTNWFDSWSSQFAGGLAHMCISSPVCGRALSMERDGQVYSCDHFVYPEYCVGDINESSLTDMVRSARQRKFGEAKQTSLPQFCRKCPFLFACYGECPKRRFLRAPDGENGNPVKSHDESHIIKCKNGHKLMVPGGLGTLHITCPKCQDSFDWSPEAQSVQVRPVSASDGRQQVPPSHKRTNRNRLKVGRWPLVIGILLFVGFCFCYLPSLVSPGDKQGHPPMREARALPPTTVSEPPRNTPLANEPPEFPPLPLPPHGETVRWYSGDCLPVLNVVTPQGGHTFVKVESWDTGSPVATLFVHSGMKASVNLPPGSYRIKFAVGETWYGNKYLFGPPTQCSVAKEPCTLNVSPTANGQQFDEITIELQKQINGNLETKPINVEDF